MIDQQLYEAARKYVMQKSAFVPPTDPSAGMPPGGDPSAMQGQPGMDPSMGQGGMPPGMPPGGGVAPTDPAAMQPAPPPQAPPGMAPAAPQAAPQQQAAGGKPKFDPLALDYRIYNLQQLVTAIANSMNVTIPPGALIMPPGSAGAPPAEAALPGGPGDPGLQQQQQQPQQGGIQPMPSAGDAQGMMPKTAAQIEQEEREFAALIDSINKDPSDIWEEEKKASQDEDAFDFSILTPATAPVTVATPAIANMNKNAATLAAMFRANRRKA